MIQEESLKYVLWLLNDCIEKDLWYEINPDKAKILLDYIQQRDSIIKEVREYMKKQLDLLPHYMYEAEMYKVLEILDKVEENK